MLAIIDFLLARKKTYWDIRFRLRITLHHLNGYIYVATWKLRSLRRKAILFKELSRLSMINILFTFLLVALIYLVPYLFNLDIVNKETIFQAYNEILSTIAGVCGVIIGLYYAASVSLGTTTYGKLPQDVRSLLASEPIGNVFIGFLAFITFLCITLLSLQFFGFEQSSLGIQFVLLCSGIAVFGLSKMGSRLIFLTDPASLAYVSNKILEDMFKMSTVGRFQWNNKNFQQHFEQNARSALKTIETVLIVVKNDNEIAHESLLQLSKNSVQTLIRYQNLKRRIPSGSKWYKTKYKHNDWYKASDFSISIHEMQGHIRPEEIRDHLWIENELIKPLLASIECNIESFKHDLLINNLNDVERLLEKLLENCEMEFCISLLNKISSQISRIIDIGRGEKDKASKVYYLNAIEHFKAMKTNLIINFLQNKHHYDMDSLFEKVKQIDWRNRNSLYASGLPYYLHERTEWLFDCFLMENRWEDRHVTPAWYTQNLIAQEVGRKFKKDVLALYDFILEEKILETNANSELVEAIIIDRSHEQLMKLELFLKDFKSIALKIESFRKIPTLPWSTIDWSPIDNKLFEYKKKVIFEISRLAGLLSLNKFDEDLPDFRGKFLHTTGLYILDSMLTNPSYLTPVMFNGFFVGSFNKFSELISNDPEEPEWIKKQKIQIAVAPMIDLMAISGYALLLSEAHKTPDIWSIVKKTWDDHIGKDRAGVLKWLAAVHFMPETELFTIAHRSMYRMGLYNKTRDYLEDTIKCEEKYENDFGMGYDKKIIVDHESPLIKVFLKKASWSSDLEGNDIFIDLYLKKYPEASGLEFSRNQGDLDDAISREEKGDLDE